jgi:23S rRNA (cytosine1962-C5)-methyltransferase
VKHPLPINPPSRAWLPPARLATLAAAGTNAHRLCSGPDGWIERLDADVLVCFKSDPARDELLAGLEKWASSAGWQPRRVFVKFLPRQNEDRISPVLFSGDAALPPTAVVTEAGVRYALDFSAGYSHGLFLDQRANRAFLRRVAPKKLLNTFAYTCSFSVVAALAGAETLSVDLSKKSLDRGRENFALNKIAIAADTRHRFLADDVLEVLPRLARRGEKFDAIVLDPPTFSRGNQGRRWQVEQHFEDLLLAALEVSAPRTRMLLSTNCAKLDPRTLERMARFCLKTQRRGGDFHREPALPDFPPGQGASTLWLTTR